MNGHLLLEFVAVIRWHILKILSITATTSILLTDEPGGSRCLLFARIASWYDLNSGQYISV